MCVNAALRVQLGGFLVAPSGQVPYVAVSLEHS